MKKKQALRNAILTPQLLVSNGWTWEWPADHCNYQWYSKKGCDIELRYYKSYGEFQYKRAVRTVGELKDLGKVVYHQKISILI